MSESRLPMEMRACKHCPALVSLAQELGRVARRFVDQGAARLCREDAAAMQSPDDAGQGCALSSAVWNRLLKEQEGLQQHQTTVTLDSTIGRHKGVPREQHLSVFEVYSLYVCSDEPHLLKELISNEFRLCMLRSRVGGGQEQLQGHLGIFTRIAELRSAAVHKL